MRNSNIAWQSELSYSLYQRQSFPKRILHTRTVHTNTHSLRPPPSSLCSSRYMTIRLFRRGDPQSQRITFKTKGLCSEREAGRKRPLKHTTPVHNLNDSLMLPSLSEQYSIYSTVALESILTFKKWFATTKNMLLPARHPILRWSDRFLD